MGTIVVNYNTLNIISTNASNTATQLSAYIDDLSNKVVSKYEAITNGQTSKTQNSEYYVKQKVSKLKEKKAQYNDFSKSINALINKAAEIDRDVAKTIKASKDQFIDKHDYIDTSWWTSVKEWFVDLKNSCPLFEAIGNLIAVGLECFKSLWAFLKHWYKCGGGKELIGVVLAIAGAVCAVVIAVCTLVPPICGIVAICAAIGAVIAAVNSIVNVVTSIESANAKFDGDPAWAKIYGDRDTLQDVLRENNFKSGFWNKLSYWGATGIDVVQTVCDFVAIVDGIKNIKNIFKEINISAKKGKVKFGERIKQYIFNKDTRNAIQDRAKIRTMREYGITKARTMATYTKRLPKVKKFFNKIEKAAKAVKKYTNYTGNAIGYVFDFSAKSFIFDNIKGLGVYYKSPNVALNIHNFYNKDIKSIINKSNINGMF